MRDYLVFCSTRHGQCNAELGLYGEDRVFDLCIHDYSDWGGEPEGVFKRSEYWFPRPRAEKLETAAMVLPTLPSYKYYMCADDDITATTDQLNRLFLVGEALQLDLYQPALTKNSYASHRHLYQIEEGAPVRKSEFTEIMIPLFSKAALDRCLWSFSLNVSGWGADMEIWPKLIPEQQVINSIAVGHYRSPARRQRILSNGLTPMQEYEVIRKIQYDGDSPW